jgi:hypothetical protein
MTAWQAQPSSSPSSLATASWVTTDVTGQLLDLGIAGVALADLFDLGVDVGHDASLRRDRKYSVPVAVHEAHRQPTT